MKELLIQLILFVLFVEPIITYPLAVRLKQSAASKCIIQILSSYFKLAQKIAIHFSFNSENVATSILQSVDVPVIMNALEYRRTIGIERGMSVDLIIILSELADLAKILRTTLWYGDTFFLIVLNSTDDLNIAFDTFWENRIVNVFAFIQNMEELNIYTFLPYSSKKCGVGEPFIIDTWKNNIFVTGNISQIQDKERIKNMNGCPVNVTFVDVKPFIIFEDECDCNGTKHADGVEGKMMTEVTKILNFNASYYLPRDGQIWGYIRPTPGGAVGEVFTKKSEFTIGMLGPVMERYENLDFSIPYTPMECVTFGVPKGMREKQKVWISFLLSEFSKDIWAVLFCSVIITVVVFWVIDEIQNQFPNHIRLLFYVISIILGTPMRSPTTKALKILFLTWAWISFILMSAYQGSLSSKLTAPTSDKDIETFEQLLESKLILTGYPNMYTTLSVNKNDSNFEKMLRRFVITNRTVENAIESMTSKRDLAYIRHISTFLYYSYLHEDTQRAVNVLKDCLYVYYPTFMMKKYSPYTNQVNKIIDRLFRGGIIKHWTSHYLFRFPDKSNPVVKLTLAKLKGIFFFLLGGMLVSFLIFLIECCCNKRRNWKILSRMSRAIILTRQLTFSK